METYLYKKEDSFTRKGVEWNNVDNNFALYPSILPHLYCF